MIGLALSFQEFGHHKMAYLNQIAEDWETLPFVNLTVTTDTRCPTGTEEVIYKTWMGSKLYCAYNDIAFWTLNEGRCYVDKDHPRDCDQVPALSLVIQAQFGGKRICGERGGLNFTQITRVERNGKCPTGTTPCNSNTRSERTICYPPADHAKMCPITDINIVSQAQASSMSDYHSLPLGNDQVLVFSKSTDSMPPTSMRMEH